MARASQREFIANSVLAALPRALYLRLLAKLVPVEVVFGNMLYQPGARIDYVYFPTTCVVSLLTPVAQGRLTLEVGMVGREGMVGVPLALGMKRTPMRALVQGTGSALKMSAAHFSAALQGSGPLRGEVNRYIFVLMAQISQTAACNRFHTVDARLARWLLMTRDRIQSASIHLTQDFLSHMLGVRRVGVTQAASKLQRRNLIDYNRGRIEILDHAGLEIASCECYEIVKGMQDGVTTRKPWNSNGSGRVVK